MEQYIQLIRFADDSYGAIVRSIDYGQAVIILLLTAIVFLQAFDLWSRAR